MSALVVTNAVLDGETVGVRCVDGVIAAIGAGVVAARGDEAMTPPARPSSRRWSTVIPTRR